MTAINAVILIRFYTFIALYISFLSLYCNKLRFDHL